MTSPLNALADSLISSAGVAQHAGEEVRFMASGYSVDLTATVMDVLHQVDEVSGQLIRWDGATFQIDASDLVLNGYVTEPQVGMRIQRTKGGATVIYEVQPPSQSQRHFDEMLGGLRLVVYAVRIKG